MSRTKEERRRRRHARVRRKIEAKDPRPRLCVYRSNRYLTAQVINDQEGRTLAAVSSKGLSGTNLSERSHQAGLAMAEVAKGVGVSEVVFDRGGYLFTGRVRAFAQGAREGGLVF